MHLISERIHLFGFLLSLTTTTQKESQSTDLVDGHEGWADVGGGSRGHATDVQEQQLQQTNNFNSFENKDITLHIRDLNQSLGSMHDLGFGWSYVKRRTRRRVRNAVRTHNVMAPAEKLVDTNKMNDFHLHKGLLRTGKIRHSDHPFLWEIVSQHKIAVVYSVDFRTPAAYVVIPLTLYSTYAISFKMKTIESNGLLLYVGSDSNHFLAVELVNQQIHYLYNLGHDPRVISVNLYNPLNDNKWHQIDVFHTSPSEHVLCIDNTSKSSVTHDTRNTYIDVNSKLYFGGIPSAIYSSLPKQIKSQVGFVGCLSNLMIANELPNVSDEILVRLPEEFREDVRYGCQEEMVGECGVASCSNGGVCHQEFESFTCDCDMTSFVGKTCDEDGIAYKFGRQGGLITFIFHENEKTDTQQDALAFGFITTQLDCILVRVTSGSSDDYIQVELIDGNVFVVYNIGTADHPIGELFKKVNDNNYHVVKFMRFGANSTLQIDNLSVQRKIPTGRQLSRFNNMEKVYIGGKPNAMGKRIGTFHGTISGFVLNGLHLLNYASEGDKRTLIEGETELVTKPLRPYRYISTASNAFFMKLVTVNRTLASKPRGQYTSPLETTEQFPDIKMLPIKRIMLCHPDEKGQCQSIKGNERQTTRSQFPDSTIEHHLTNLNTTVNYLCLINKIGCHNPTVMTVLTYPPQSSHPDGRTRPIFLSHLEPASRPPPTNSASNSTDSMIENKDLTDKKLELSRTSDEAQTITTSWHLGLTVGIAVSITIFFLLVMFGVYKYRSRDEGTYRIDEGTSYGYDSSNFKPLIHLNGRARCSQQKNKDTKEWYV